MAHKLPPVPTTDEYRRALARFGNVSDLHLRLLRAHYFAPEHKATATELARAVGFDNWRAVNLQYGLLGEKLRVALGFDPGDQAQASYSLASFVPPGEEGNSEWVWVMHPELTQALEALAWVEGPVSLLPQEAAAATALVEGAVRQVLVDTYERNSVARRQCIAHYGATCCICKFDFEAVYGRPAKDTSKSIISVLSRTSGPSTSSILSRICVRSVRIATLLSTVGSPRTPLTKFVHS